MNAPWSRSFSAEMRRLGLAGAEIAVKQPQRPNVIYRLRGGTAGPVLMLCGHRDTKPVGDVSQSQTDQLQPVFKEGRLYGRGSTDTKGAVAAIVYAVAALKQCAAGLSGEVLLVVDADEERDGIRL